jgi:Leucine-rich repeat (LRR) protein
MNGLCSDMILEVMNFLSEEEIHCGVFGKYIDDHTRQRTALSTIHNLADLEIARDYPNSGYDLTVFTLFLYSELEPEEYPRVTRLTTPLYIPPFFTNLQSLNISHSFTLRLPPELIHLKTLVCCHTPLRELPKEYTSLIDLDVSESRVDRIPEEYTLLQRLNVYGSRVSDLPWSATLLRDLNCANTDVVRIPETYCGLERLDCRLTRVSEIPDTLVKLKWLDCSDSRVDHVCEGIRRLPLTFFKEKSLFQLNYYLPIT